MDASHAAFPFAPIPANATAAEAVAAYQDRLASDYCAALGMTDQDEIDAAHEAMEEWQMDVPTPVSAARLQAVEDAQGWRFPPALARFYQQVGSFAVHGIQGLRLFSPANDYVFLNAFDNYGYADSHSEHSDLLSAAQLASLRAQFQFFAIGFYEDDGASSRLLYFHKELGYFGELLALESNHPRMRETEYAQLFDYSAPRYSLDALITLQLNRLLVLSLVRSEAVWNDALQGQPLQWLHESEMWRY